MKIHTADKDQQCILCDKIIPKGHKYWTSSFDDEYLGEIELGDIQHTNCEEYSETKLA